MSFVSSDQLAVAPRVLAYGAENAGKSHLGFSAPRPAAIDFEQRANQFKDKFTFISDMPTSFAEGIRAVAELAKPETRKQYDTIVVDSLTKPYNAVMQRFTTVKKAEGGNEFSSTDWPAVNRTMLGFIDPLLAIPGKNIICIARQNVRLERNGKDFKRAGVKMVGDENRWRFDYDYVLHYAARGEIMVEKSMSDFIPNGTLIRGDLDWTRFLRLISGEERLPDRQLRNDRQPAPVAARRVQQGADDEKRAPVSDAAPDDLDAVLVNIAPPEHRKIVALAEGKKIPLGRLRLLIASITGSATAPLLPDQVEQLVDALKRDGEKAA